MEVKNFTFDLKADAETRTIEGLGSVFGNVDSGNDIVMPGAFTKTLKSRTPAMLWQHKSDSVIGVWDEVRETPEGLYVKGRILETSLGNDAYTLAKAGALKGMSIGYATKDSSIDKKTGARQLKELELYEVSLVTFPMNEQASITRVKTAESSDVAAELIEQAITLCEAPVTTESSAVILDLLEKAHADLTGPTEADDPDKKFTPKTVERILRDAGMKRGDARRVIAVGFSAIATPRDAESDELKTLCNLFNQFSK